MATLPAVFTEERHTLLSPLKVHRRRLMLDEDEYEPMTRASEIMLATEEPSIRTYFCAKSLAMDFVKNYPNNPRGFKELGKVHLYSCVPENLILAEEALQRVQSLSNQADAEGWYLLSMCYQIRLTGWKNPVVTQLGGNPSSARSHHRQRKHWLKLAEKYLKLALRHSNGSNIYRFALSDFYISINRLSKALSSLQSGLSAPPQTKQDAAILHQLGRFGVSCVNGLWERGRKDRAKEVGLGALQYYREAIELNDREEWQTELRNAQDIIDRLEEQNSDLSDFATEPDFNPSGPISLSQWLTSASPFTPQESEFSPTQTGHSSERFSGSSSWGSPENLTEFLNKIENEALTYEGRGAEELTEDYKWPHQAVQQEREKIFVTKI